MLRFSHQLCALSCAALIILGSLLITMPSGKGAVSWATEVVDPRDTNYRIENSFVLDSLGRPHTVYHSSSALIYAVKDGGSWHYSTVESSIPMNSSTQNDLALDNSGTPYVAYRNYTHIWLAKYDGAYWRQSDVFDGQENGRDVTIALNRSGYPRIAHVEGTPSSGTLYVSSWNGYSWITDPIETGMETVAGPIAVDRNDRVHVSYAMSGTMKHAYYDGSGWNITTVYYSSSSVMSPGGLALDNLGFPHVSFTQIFWRVYRVLHAWWNGTAWSLETVDCCDRVDHSSLALDLRNEPHVSYYNYTTFEGALIYAYKNGTSWVKESVEPSFGYTAIGVDAMLRVHIVHLEVGGHHVRYALRIPDNPLPVSRVRPVNPHWWNSVPLYLQVDATDLNGSVDRIDLYYRFDAGAGWGPWSQYVFSRSPPWIFPFGWPDGEGKYEFYSLAFDGLEWELKIESAEASAGYDITPPFSMALPISPYWHSTSPMSVDATASDNLSGVANVTLFYSYAPLDNSSWSAWTAFGTRYSPPWSWSFPFPDGKGNYRFHTIATDVAGNVEGAKTIAEAVAGYNGTAPVTMPDYSPINEQPVPPIRVGFSSQVSLSLAVHSGGNATAATDTVLAFYNSTAPATPFRTFTVSPIVPGGNSSRFTATWISPAIPGTYRVSTDIDYWNNVTEWNEENNVFTWTVNVVTGPITSLIIGYPNYTSPAMTTYVKSTTPLSLSVLDQSGLGIRNTTYTIDGGNPVNYTATGTFFLAGEGVHKIEWQSLDWAGNLEDSNTMNLTVDDTPPATTIHKGEEQATTATVFTLTATDSGCGVNVTRYRIDGGSWAAYSGGFTLSEGEHNITYYSNDMLNNTEGEKRFVVTVQGTTTPPETTVNYKPIVALLFATILLVAGVWSSKRRPWKGGKDRMAVAKAFTITSLPFILLETATGIVSFMTGLLSIPPVVDLGTGVDVVILVAGLTVAIFRMRVKAPMPE
jgi:hypothetical protein